MTDELKKLRRRMQACIEEYGYFVQGVQDPEGGYCYTFGRNDRGLEDLIILNTDKTFSTLRSCGEMVEQVFAILNHAKEIQRPYVFGMVEESASLVCAKHPSQATRFKILKVDPAQHQDKILGILNRGKALSEIQLCQLIVAGPDNTF